MKRFFGIIVFVSLMLTGLTARSAQKDTLRILAIGNSFSWNAVEQNLGGIALADGKCAIIGNMYIGGCSLERHWNNAQTGSKDYSYRKINQYNVKTTKGEFTLEEALALFQLPRNVGSFENEDVIVSIGKFGPYVRHKNLFYSLSKSDDPYEINLDRCIEIIKNKREAEKAKAKLHAMFPRQLGIHDGYDVFANIGRYGPYLSYRNKNYRLPKDLDPLDISIEEAKEIIMDAETEKTPARKKKKA